MAHAVWLILNFDHGNFMNLTCVEQISHCLCQDEVGFGMDSLARNGQASRFSPCP